MAQSDFALTNHQQTALRGMLSKAGAHQTDRAVCRLEEHGRRLVTAAKATGEGLAIERCSLCQRLSDYSNRLYYWIETLDSTIENRLCRCIGEDRSGKRSSSAVDRGRNFIEETALVGLDYIGYGARVTFTRMHERAWHGDAEQDRAFRQWCGDLGKIWKDETGQRLPVVQRASGIDWFHEGDTPQHPLWLLLNAAGVNVDGATAYHLTEYAATGVEPLEECE